MTEELHPSIKETQPTQENFRERSERLHPVAMLNPEFFEKLNPAARTAFIDLSENPSSNWRMIADGAIFDPKVDTPEPMHLSFPVDSEIGAAGGMCRLINAEGQLTGFATFDFFRRTAQNYDILKKGLN